MSNVYGIDLGTTYSRIAYVDEYGKPVVLESNKDGLKSTPSVVYFEPESKKIIVGRAAKGMAKVREDRVVSTVKRVMGEPDWVFECDGQTYKPQDISAIILKSIVDNAREVEGLEEIKDVVISCPAYFGVNQKEATKQAGEIAGLNVLTIIPEPTAAAIAYGINQQEDQVVMVYDLGGGTFDVTLIDVKSNAIEVIATGGVDKLGGKDWDEAIVNYLAQSFQDQTGMPYQDLIGDLEQYQSMLNEAELLKMNLVNMDKVEHLINYGGTKARIELTRDKFNEITSHLFEETMTYTREMIERAKQKGYDKIDKILVVGGSTFMPQVKERLMQFDIPIVQQDPNYMVAMGAAIYAHALSISQEIKISIAKELGVTPEEVKMEEVPETVKEKAEQEVADSHGMTLPDLQKSTKTIKNVTAKSFGVVVITGVEDGNEILKANNIIIRDEQVPCEREILYSTYYDDQNGARIKVVENIIPVGSESYVDMDKCTQIAEAELIFLRNLPKGSPVKVWCKLNENGILEMRAEDTTTNQAIELNKVTESILSAEELAASKNRLSTTNIT